MSSLLSIFSRARSFPARASIFRYHTFAARRPLPILKVAGVVSVGLGLSVFGQRKIYCDPSPERTSVSSPLPEPEKDLPPPPPLTSVSIHELTFGTLAGISAGIFIKKGVKAVAFLLGASFILLQYLGSISMLRVDWARMERRFEEIVYIRDSSGKRRAPTVAVAWRALVNFLVADFPPRASFLAGLVLGLRIG